MPTTRVNFSREITYPAWLEPITSIKCDLVILLDYDKEEDLYTVWSIQISKIRHYTGEYMAIHYRIGGSITDKIMGRMITEGEASLNLLKQTYKELKLKHHLTGENQ